MKDFYGNDLHEGDKVIFAVGSWGPAKLREVVYLREHSWGGVTIRPTRNHSGEITRTKYIDKRTGRFTDWTKHIAVQSHWIDKTTGDRLVNKNFVQFNNIGWGRTPDPNPDYVPPEHREYVEMKLQDYILEVTLPGGTAVVLPSAKNVVRIGQL